MKMTVFIPSLGWPVECATNPLLPYSTVVLAGEEVEKYEAEFEKRGVRPQRIITGNGFGLPHARNLCLQHWDDEDVQVQVDDDTTAARRMMRFGPEYITDGAHLMDILASTARLALDMRSTIFGYLTNPVPMQRNAYKPFDLRGRVDSSIHGCIDPTFSWDEHLIVSSDIDATLESIRRSRLALVDNRYGWLHERWTRGGLAKFRSSDTAEKSLRYLEQKWGRGVIVRTGRTKVTGGPGFGVRLK